MNPLYFGDPERPLYGVYHPPAPGANARTGVLICPADGLEYLPAHWGLVQVARRLTGSGYHVLRFDYYATGDSAGETGQGSVQQWTDDVRTAAGELRDLSGCDELSLLGLRLGALLAASAAIDSAHELVLWDPVVRGGEYLQELRDASPRLLARAGLSSPDPALDAAGNEQLLGFPYSPRLREGIEQLDLAEVELVAARVVLIESAGKTGRSALHVRLEAAARDFEHIAVPASARWYARYASRSVVPPAGALDPVCRAFPGARR